MALVAFVFVPGTQVSIHTTIRAAGKIHTAQVATGLGCLLIIAALPPMVEQLGGGREHSIALESMIFILLVFPQIADARKLLVAQWTVNLRADCFTFTTAVDFFHVRLERSIGQEGSTALSASKRM